MYKIRHVLPPDGHYASFISQKEPYGFLLPLTDRALVVRQNEDGEQEDAIVGFVIDQTEYRVAEDTPDDQKFIGYISPEMIKRMAARNITLDSYEMQLVQWGQEWVRRSAPKVVPAQIEALFPEPDFPEEPEPATPPRKRARGR
jgi:hypothetical protein